MIVAICRSPAGLHAAEHLKLNKHGNNDMSDKKLDANYFEKKLKTVVRDVKMYTPDEMFNELSRLMMVAAHQAELNVSMTVEPNTQ